MAARHVRAADFLRVQRRLLLDSLQSAGIADPIAVSIASRFQDALQFSLGGAKVYFAKRSNAASTRAARARALRGDGMRVNDIAARIGLSVSSTYELLREHPRAIERDRATGSAEAAVSRAVKVLPPKRCATAAASASTPPGGPGPAGGGPGRAGG